MLIYNLYPLLIGPLTNWRQHLLRAATMGFEWIYVNPIHLPGRSGSIYSISDYFKINPLFINPDDTHSAEDQFRAITGYAAELGLHMMADLVVNHCAVDSPLTGKHPEWFISKPNGQFAHPFLIKNEETAVWTDSFKFAHSESAYDAGFYSFTLEIADYLLSLGFEGFRCDSAYQVPTSFWKRFILDVRQKYPDCVFIAEALGCSIAQVRQTASGGFDFMYNSVKWWNYEDAWLLQQHDLLRDSIPTVSFPETHDTDRLYHGSECGVSLVKQRCLFTAFFSAAWLIPIGFEYGFTKKLRASRTQPTDWETANFDIQTFISRIIKTKKRYAVLIGEGPIRVLPSPNPSILILWKSTNDAVEEALIVLNKDVYNKQYFEVDNLGFYVQFARKLEDVSPEFSFGSVSLGHFACELGPGQSLVFVGGIDEALEKKQEKPAQGCQFPDRTPLKKNDTENPLCILPWIHSCIMPSGHVKLCCVSGSGGAEPILGSVWETSLHSIHTSERIRSIRAQMLSGSWPAECSYCRIKEQRGMRSSRQIHNELHEPYFLTLKKLRERFIPSIRSIDLRIDNTCNFKCRSCSGFCSTRWFCDHNIIYPENPLSSPNIDLRQANQFWNELHELISERIERLHFAGGEPLISESHYDLLDHLIHSKRFGIELYYDTNLSCLEFMGRDIVKLWNLFPSVTVGLSLDGIGAQGEYIRHGLNFEQWHSNVNRLRDELPHVKRKLHFVVSVFNVMTLKGHLLYIIENGLVDPDMMRLTFLEWPAYLNAQILPKHLKSICKSRLLNFYDTINKISVSLASQLAGLVKFLDERDLYESQSEEFAAKTAHVDKLRGESGIKMFPDISELFKEV